MRLRDFFHSLGCAEAARCSGYGTLVRFSNFS